MSSSEGIHPHRKLLFQKGGDNVIFDGGRMKFWYDGQRRVRNDSNHNRQIDRNDTPCTARCWKGTETINRNLERDFQFLGVVYRDYRKESGPGLFKNPLARHSDAVTFTQISLFLPWPRRYLSTGDGESQTGLGGTFGFSSNVPLPPPPATGEVRPEDERWPSENWPIHWDLLNQNWTVKIVPATASVIPEILQTPPGNDVRTPNLDGAQVEQMNRVNTH